MATYDLPRFARPMDTDTHLILGERESQLKKQCKDEKDALAVFWVVALIATIFLTMIIMYLYYTKKYYKYSKEPYNNFDKDADAGTRDGANIRPIRFKPIDKYKGLIN